MKQIDKYMTVAEAAHRWNVPQETIKNKLKPAFPASWAQTEAMIEEGLLKFFQKEDGKRKEWIITTSAMEKWFNKREDIKMRKWEREGYTVVEVKFDYDLHAFDVIKDDGSIQQIQPADIEAMNQILEDLDNGEDVDGWEDGMGNTITI